MERSSAISGGLEKAKMQLQLRAHPERLQQWFAYYDRAAIWPARPAGAASIYLLKCSTPSPVGLADFSVTKRAHCHHHRIPVTRPQVRGLVRQAASSDSLAEGEAAR